MAPRYRLTSKIEDGALAELFRGVAEGSERPVLVKLFTSRASDLAYARALAETGAKTRALGNASAVGFEAVGLVQDRIAAVREYIEGYTLGDALRRLATREVVLPPPLALHLVAETAQVVASAHARGWVHGAITPGNILIGFDGRIRVVDFGAIEAISASEALAPLLGKGRQSYRAPEAKRAAAATSAADVYSLGAIAYELLTLREVAGARSGGISTKRDALTPPSRLERRLNPRLDSVILRALELAPTRRYRSAVELAEAVRGLFSVLGYAPSSSEMARFAKELFPGEVSVAGTADVPFREPFALAAIPFEGGAGAPMALPADERSPFTYPAPQMPDEMPEPQQEETQRTLAAVDPEAEPRAPAADESTQSGAPDAPSNGDAEWDVRPAREPSGRQTLPKAVEDAAWDAPAAREPSGRQTLPKAVEDLAWDAPAAREPSGRQTLPKAVEDAAWDAPAARDPSGRHAVGKQAEAEWDSPSAREPSGRHAIARAGERDRQGAPVRAAGRGATAKASEDAEREGAASREPPRARRNGGGLDATAGAAGADTARELPSAAAPEPVPDVPFEPADAGSQRPTQLDPPVPLDPPEPLPQRPASSGPRLSSPRSSNRPSRPPARRISDAAFDSADIDPLPTAPLPSSSRRTVPAAQLADAGFDAADLAPGAEKRSETSLGWEIEPVEGAQRNRRRVVLGGIALVVVLLGLGLFAAREPLGKWLRRTSAGSSQGAGSSRSAAAEPRGARAWLTIHADVPASVFVDGKNTGKTTNLTRFAVTPGLHSVLLLYGGATREFDVNLRPNEETQRFETFGGGTGNGEGGRR